MIKKLSAIFLIGLLINIAFPYDEFPINIDDPSVQDYFGSSVDISGDYAIIGARSWDGDYTDQGAAFYILCLRC